MIWKRALITGASSGIGRATAAGLAKEGLDLILIARRMDRLEKLRRELEGAHKVRVIPVAADIRDHDDLQKKFQALGADLDKVDVLVNNAGLARGTAKMSELHPNDWNEMIDTNIKGLVSLTRLLLPHFLKNQRGHIVNLGSVAGRWVYPGGAVYCATKFAVRAISDSLRLELLGTPIRLTNIEPGMVETEFSNVRLKDDAKAKAVYEGMTPLSSEDIAESIVWSLSRPAHVNIQEMVIFPTDQAGVGPSYTHRR
jgi:NADP-dependent 3-hydroxy acid dehydrogenase YdfG